jgi:hypothetical protein
VSAHGQKHPATALPDAAELWSIQMEAYAEPVKPSPTVEQCLNGGHGWLEISARNDPAKHWLAQNQTTVTLTQRDHKKLSTGRI